MVDMHKIILCFYADIYILCAGYRMRGRIPFDQMCIRDRAEYVTGEVLRVDGGIAM